MAHTAPARSGFTIGFGSFIIIVWLLVGLLAAAQRGYLSRDEASCSTVTATIITVVAGPLNYFGANPQVKCQAPAPSK